MQRHWYRPSLNLITMSLLPLSWLFGLIVSIRKSLYRKKIKKTICFPVPVIVVGNITVGGTGKTPFVIWLANLLKKYNFKPGIVSRGVGGKQQRLPRWVQNTSDVRSVGDEALLLKQTDCPVVIGIDRVLAVKELLDKTDCNIIICDDGLQHYRLGRHLEIALVDGDRLLGNKKLLPAGPLREPDIRLSEVDFVVVQGEKNSLNINKEVYLMKLQAKEAIPLINAQQLSTLESFKNRCIHAVAGIGNPDRFFTFLRDQGLDIIEHVFPDHHLYSPQDLHFSDHLPILMTEKDAVKCRAFADERFFYLPVEVIVDMRLEDILIKKIYNSSSAFTSFPLVSQLQKPM